MCVPLYALNRLNVIDSPGFPFHVADGLLTNFHLPASTLPVLVFAFGGYARVRSAYQTAVDRGYRLFSFGDAMFIEREHIVIDR